VAVFKSLFVLHNVKIYISFYGRLSCKNPSVHFKNCLERPLGKSLEEVIRRSILFTLLFWGARKLQGFGVHFQLISLGKKLIWQDWCENHQEPRKFRAVSVQV
jgi:hypothetical protein